MSRAITATRGITAGSSFAMTELRVILIRGLDSLVESYPLCKPIVYVDDMFLSARGRPRQVAHTLVNATRHLADKNGTGRHGHVGHQV